MLADVFRSHNVRILKTVICNKLPNFNDKKTKAVLVPIVALIIKKLDSNRSFQKCFSMFTNKPFISQNMPSQNG